MRCLLGLIITGRRLSLEELYDETTDSFIWLFETFLQAMSGKAPKTIFTNQDAAMANAILHVMPYTYHRLCTWHMMQNALKHVNGVFRGEVKHVLSQFSDEIEEENDFLMAWTHICLKNKMCMTILGLRVYLV